MPYTIPKGSILGQRGVAAVLAVCCVRRGPCRLLCLGGGVPCGGKHIIIISVQFKEEQVTQKHTHTKKNKDRRTDQKYENTHTHTHDTHTHTTMSDMLSNCC